MSPKRKGPKRKTKPAKPKAPDTGFGTLADQVKSVRRDLRAERRPEEELREARRKADRAARAAAGQTKPDQPKRRLTRDELMAEAFGAIGEQFTGAEKYLGDGFDASNVELIEERSIDARDGGGAMPNDGLSADDLLFAELMAADVARMDSKKTALAEREWAGVKWRTQTEIASLTADDLARLEITSKQRDLLRRSRKTTMQVVKLRYLRKRDALADIEAFVYGCYGRDERFARVIHGKGRQSAGDPVLKPAVVAWCEGEGAKWVRAWAPEIDTTGQFGSLVVELHRRR